MNKKENIFRTLARWFVRWIFGLKYEEKWFGLKKEEEKEISKEEQSADDVVN